MVLTQGVKLGPYEVVEELGSGGMGQVFRARDTRLGRDVALKVLPGTSPDDEGLLRRFESEARAAAALDHPNILAIHDVGSEDGTPYIVTELLEGETLRARLGDGTALPLRKVLDYASQVARGLAEAHAKGIVHRDLKPENLFVTTQGRVKILDFGIAKLMGNAEVDPKGETASHTRPGEILGTVGYMSPEQVRGQAADPRSDLFSFGCILYELVTGARAFDADSRVETAYAILNDDPEPLESAGRRVPPALARIIERCLEKHPGERFQSASDLAFNLEKLSGITSLVTGGELDGLTNVARGPGTLVRGLVVGALALAAGAGLFVLGGRLAVRPGSTVASVVRSAAPHAIPAWQQLTFRKGKIMSARFSPDGATVVYSANHGGKGQDLYTTMTSSPESRPLGYERTQLASVSSRGELAIIAAGAAAGSELGNWQTATLARVPLAGGAPRELVRGVVGADWAPDGEAMAVVRVEPGGTRLEFPIGRPRASSRGYIGSVRVSPDGASVAFLEHPQMTDDRGLVVVVGPDGERRELTGSFASANGLAWSPDGREVWFTAADAGLARALRSVALDGTQRILSRAPGALTLHDVAPDGRILVTSDQDRMRIWAGGLTKDAPGQDARSRDAKGRWERDLSWFDWSLLLDLSADGKAIIFNESGNGAGDVYSLYLRHTDGSPAVKLGSAGVPATLSPDGSRVLAASQKGEHLVLLPTGAGEARTLNLSTKLSFLNAFAWLPDGRRALLHARADGQLARVWLVDTVTRALMPLSAEGVSLGGPHAVSPQGSHAVVYHDEQIGLLALAPSGVPGASAPPAVSTRLPGLDPRLDHFIGWRADGKAIRLGTVRGGVPHIEELVLASGKRTPIELGSGMHAVGQLSGLFITPDGRVGATSYLDVQSDLYLLELTPSARGPREAAVWRGPRRDEPLGG